MQAKIHYTRAQIEAAFGRLAVIVALTLGSLIAADPASADHLSINVERNDIEIEGDFLSNAMTVTIVDDTSGRSQHVSIRYSGSVEVRGVDASNDTRRKQITFSLAPFVDDLRINTYGGHDSITVNRFRAGGSNADIVIDSGDEWDDIVVTNVSVRDVILIGGTGDDDMQVTDCNATGWIAMRGQEGGNRIHTAGCTSHLMGLRGGERRDDITVDAAAVGTLYISGYEGNDVIELGHFVDSNNSLPTLYVDHLEIDTGEGDDSIEGHYLEALNMVIETGDDKDEIFLPVIDGDVLEIDTGRDNDLINIGGMVSDSVNSSLIIRAGSGNDDVILGAGSTPIDFNLDWMEVRMGTGNDHYFNYVNGLVGDYVWSGGSGYDTHWFIPFVGTLYADPWKTLRFEN